MYKQQHDIGGLNARPIVENWAFTADEAGGVQKELDNSFYVWAKVEPQSGGMVNSEGQLKWVYDAKFIIRHNANVVSSSTIVWQNKRYQIKELSTVEDTKKRFMVLRCEVLDNELVTSGIITPVGPAYVYNYHGVGGETEFDNVSLINKTIIGVFKDGIAKEVIFAGIPTDGQCLYTPSTGEFEFGVPFYAGEVAIIQYL